MRLGGRIRLVKMIEWGVDVDYHETISLASASFFKLQSLSFTKNKKVPNFEYEWKVLKLRHYSMADTMIQRILNLSYLIARLANENIIFKGFRGGLNRNIHVKGKILKKILLANSFSLRNENENPPSFLDLPNMSY